MLRAEIRQLIDNLAVLRGFVDAIAPVLLERGEQTVKSRADALAPLLLLLARAEALRNPGQPGTELLPKGADLDALETTIRQRFSGSILIEPAGEKGLSLKLDGPDVPKFDEAIKDISLSFSQTRLLYRSALISLISFVEWFVSQLLHKYFERYPEAVGSSDKIFSLADLQQFSSLEDARTAFVAGKVEDIMRGSFEDWLKFLQNRVGLSMGYLNTELDALSEVFQRRNILVHAGGRVGRIYLAKVHTEHRKGISLGDEIDVPLSISTPS